jgi:hypothetical protein
MKWCGAAHAWVVGMYGKLGTSISEVANLIHVRYEGFCDMTLCGGNFNTLQPF